MRSTVFGVTFFAAAMVASFSSDASRTLVTEGDVAYQEKPAKMMLDIHFLEKPQGLRPALVMIHGGAWRGLDKKNFTRVAKEGASRGYMVFNINYRLAQQAKYPAAVLKGGLGYGVWGRPETRRAARNPKPEALNPSRATCVVDFYGVADLTPTELTEKYAGRFDFVPMCENFIGKKHPEAPELFVEASPVHRVTKEACPFLIVHGDADLIVPYDQSVRFVEKLKKAGIEATLHTVKGGGHGPSFRNAPGKDAAYEAMWNFLAEHLKP